MGLSHYRERTGYTKPPCDRPDDCEYCQALMIANAADSIAAINDLFRRSAAGEPVTVGRHAEP